MRCLYCDKPINKYDWYSLFLEEDELCLECREKLKAKKRKFMINDLKVTYYYDYDSLFKTLLLQYKECYDEALSGVFLYKLDYKIWLRYRGYKIAYVKSSNEKLNLRGFDHLKLIFEPLGLKEIEGLSIKTELIQEGKNLEERSKMKDNYLYTGEHEKKVLIVDDVCTTGSSLLGVYNALSGKCDKIEALVLANKNKYRKGFH